ncbi:MAG: hypothetical protein ACI30H_08610 [Paludibacteraceae bacterium]
MRTRFLIVALFFCTCSVWAYYGSGDAVYGGVAAPAYAGSAATSAAQYGTYYNSGVNTAGTVARSSRVRLSEIGAARPDLMGDKYTPFAGSSRPGTTIHARSVTNGGGMGSNPGDDFNRDPESPIGDAVPFMLVAALLYGLMIKFRNLKTKKIHTP